MSDQRYDLRGVSASKEDVHNAIKNVDKGLYPKAFCKIIPDILGGDPEWCNIMHADGAGTKSSLAYAYWRETGDLSVWRGIAQDALVMNLDDLLCVGATDNILVSSTIGRNKMLVPGEVIAAIINGTEELLAGLRDMGISIYSTGGETAAVPSDLVYSGSMELTQAVEGSPVDAGKLVLSPTRTYAPVVKELLNRMRPAIHGMVHCSGGAQTKVMHFVENKHVIKDNLFPTPVLFEMIQRESGTDWKEMYKVFNMGHRLEVYLPSDKAAEVIAISESFGIPARIVGRVEERGEGNLLTIKSSKGTFEYL